MRRGAPTACLIAVLLLASVSSAAAQTPLAVLTASNGSGDPGENGINVSVSLSSQGGAEVSIVNFDLNFDSNRLSVASITIGSAASNAGKAFIPSQPSPGVVRVIIWDPELDPEIIANGTLANVSFNVLGGAASGPSDLILTGVTVGDLDVQAVPHSVNNGTFTVIASPTDTPVPSNTPTPSNTLTPTITQVPPTPTYSATPGPSPTASLTPTPSNTSPPTATNTPGPSPTASTNPSGTLTPSATTTSTATGQATTTRTPTSEGAGEGLELKGAAAATGTALSEFEGAVAETSTALAEEVAARPTDQIVATGPSSGLLQRSELIVAAGLLPLTIVLGGGAAYLIWRRQQA